MFQQVRSAVVRFAGDSGDGMQLAGMQFSNASAIFGNDVSTFPDYPAEIRAPAGTLAGVSGFQINFSSFDIHTPGDRVQTLIAMNPAALKVNLPDLEPGGMLIVDEDAFDQASLAKAGYESDPLEDGSLQSYRVFRVPIDRLNREAVKDLGLSPKATDRSRNFFALGLVYWLYDRPLEPTLRWIREKFGKNPEVVEANTRSLRSGYDFGDNTEIFPNRYVVPRAPVPPGRYRAITGNQATALGLVAAAERAGKTLFYGSYPITPASDILHELSRYKNFGVKTFQAEDEIAAMASTIGAAFAGAFAVTGTSGPGLSLKTEGLGLAVMLELPLLVIDVQRGGPSTGLPTKTEQSDLNMALYGRHGECPLPVLAAATPGDCFWTALEAFRIAVRYMTPVLLLTDGYLANGAEPWKIPAVDELPRIDVVHHTDPSSFAPYARDERLVRPWALPGTPGLEHRIGGLEKQHIQGGVSYDPDNHERMVRLRAEKIARIADDIPPARVDGPESGELLVLSWGGTYGAVRTACEGAREAGRSVSHLHLRYLNPLPRNVSRILEKFRRFLVCELNLGQLRNYLAATLAISAERFNHVRGKPFAIHDIREAIEQMFRKENP
ncbi:MAG: 2-oxoacid:acceptor oxidoreductase subunit alpha [Phycisphaerae bacterium]